jgi:two-component system capsular synthesis sensor histidine kinase RcsC
MSLLQLISAKLWLLDIAVQLARHWWSLIVLLSLGIVSTVVALRSGWRPSWSRSCDPKPAASDALNSAVAKLAAQQIEIETLRHELVLARAAADASERAKTNFVGSLSHELRTPLTTILGFAEMLQMGVYGKLNSEQTEILQIVQRSGWHLGQLIDDLLMYAAIEQGVAAPALADVALRPLVAQILADHRPQLIERGLEIDLVIDADVPDVIRSDDESLQQILRCLVSNATRFTEHGRISVRLHYDTPVASGRAWLRLEVEDTGIGIDLEQQEHIFEPFMKADMSNTRRRGGTGLGLAIAQRLTCMLGGSMSLVSVPGCGSCFTVRLPIAQEIAVAAMEQKVLRVG